MKKTLFCIALFCVALFSAVFLFLPKNLDPSLKFEFITAIRLPEIFAVVLAGAALSVSGLAFQTVLRNDLADPYVLGISGGSCFGVTLSIIAFGGTGSGIFFRASSSFIFGLVCLFIIIKLSGNSPERLLLLGVISNIFFSTLARVLTLQLKPSELTSINYFLLGFISPLSSNEMLFSFAAFVFFATPLFLLGDEIDILSFSDDESKTMGVNVQKTRILSILFATILASLIVSICGMIGFIGLIVPHIARIFTANDFKKLFLISIFLGPSITLFAYSFSKMANAKIVVPIGLYINLFGILFFIYLFAKKGFSNGA